MIDTLSIRNSILRLGFSGKLTSQKDSDEKVSDMLSRINPKKNIVQTEKIPYEIPQTWSWVKLSDLYSINPKVEASDSDESAFIPMERINPGFSGNFTYEVQSWEKASKNHTKFRDEDVAFAKISPCFENRKSFIARNLPNGIGGGTTELIILRQPEMLPEYTYYLVLDQRFINAGAASYKGTVGQQRVQSDVIKNYLVPVPPLSEQKRIIKKVSEAFSILDSIDDLQNQYAFNQEALKSKLIDAAIQGKLTEQLPEDGTAEELFQSIQKEKQTLIKAGKIKKDKTLPEVSDDEIPFDIPANWKWVRVNDIGSWSAGETPSRSNPGYYMNGTIPWIKTGELNDGVIVGAEEYITDKAFRECSVRLNPVGSVLIAMYGATIGKVAILDVEATTNQACCACIPIEIDNKYLFYFLKNNKKNFLAASHGGAQPNISKDIITKSLMPLPPVKEQKRIVERLDALLNALE